MSDDLLTVVGKVEGIEEKPTGWTEVKIAQPGKKYPLRLATKRANLIDAARALGTGVGTFSYKEQESERINENTGNPYTNRYLEGVEAGGTAAPATSTAGGSRGPSNDNVDWDEKDRRDFRSRAWAVTVSAFQHTIAPGEDPVLVYNRLRPFQRLLYLDVVQGLEPNNPNAQPAAPVQQTITDEPPHYDAPEDDDIPF